jgi:hypothetical protein
MIWINFNYIYFYISEIPDQASTSLIFLLCSLTTCFVSTRWLIFWHFFLIFWHPLYLHDWECTIFVICWRHFHTFSVCHFVCNFGCFVSFWFCVCLDLVCLICQLVCFCGCVVPISFCVCLTLRSVDLIYILARFNCIQFRDPLGIIVTLCRIFHDIVVGTPSLLCCSCNCYSQCHLLLPVSLLLYC